MKISLKFKSSFFHNVWHKAFYHWMKRYKIVFALLFVIVATLGGLQWYRDLMKYRWSEDQKKSYIERTVTQTIFNKEKFQHALDSLTAIKISHEKEVASVVRNLFAGKRRESR